MLRGEEELSYFVLSDLDVSRAADDDDSSPSFARKGGDQYSERVRDKHAECKWIQMKTASC
jgi:hypothetical protein